MKINRRTFVNQTGIGAASLLLSRAPPFGAESPAILSGIQISPPNILDEGVGPCWNHPDYREWIRITIDQMMRQYPLDGLQYGGSALDLFRKFSFGE